MTPGQGLRGLVLQPRTNGVESIWGAPLGPPTPHTPSVFLPLPASTDRWKRTCPFRSPRGLTSTALATDGNFPSTCVRRARGTSPCALGSPGSTSAGPRNAGLDPAPLRPAPPRCRNGARHLLFTPQPRPPGRRTGEGAGPERPSRAQLRAWREPRRSPCSRDAAAAGQVPEGFSAPRIWALGRQGGEELQRLDCCRVCPSSATFLREGEFSLTLLRLPS